MGPNQVSLGGLGGALVHFASADGILAVDGGENSELEPVSSFCSGGGGGAEVSV